MPKSSNQKENILNVALNLFARHGYMGASVSMIAAEAGISQGLMYNFFRGKEDLLRELMALAFQDIQKSMSSYLTQTDPAVAIEMHIKTTCGIIKKKSDFWRLIHSVRLQEGVPGIMVASYREIVDQVTTTFETAFSKLGYNQPKVEALLFLSQIDGIVIMYLQDDRTPIDKLANQLIKRYKK
jgi:AcrR family transcriptional regulator